jgi:transposase InsO family protein
MFVRDNSRENTSKEFNDFFTSHGVKKHFSTSYEQWQNGLAESFVGSVSMLGKTAMAESGLVGRLWFCVAQNGVICCNVIFTQSTGTTPFEKLYGI